MKEKKIAASRACWAFSILAVCSDILSFTSSMCFFLFSSALFNFDSNFSFTSSDFSAIFFSFISWAFDIFPSLAVSFCSFSCSKTCFLSSASCSFLAMVSWLLAVGDVGGDTLDFGFLTAGLSTISRLLPPVVSRKVLETASTKARSSSDTLGTTLGLPTDSASRSGTLVGVSLLMVRPAMFGKESPEDSGGVVGVTTTSVTVSGDLLLAGAAEDGDAFEEVSRVFFEGDSRGSLTGE